MVTLDGGGVCEARRGTAHDPIRARGTRKRTTREGEEGRSRHVMGVLLRRRAGGTDGSLPLAGVSSDGPRSVPEEHAVALLADDRELVVRGTCRIGDEGEGVRTPGERHPGLVFDELSTEALARVVELHGRAATRPPDVYVHDGLDRGPVVQGVVEGVLVLDLELS